MKNLDKKAGNLTFEGCLAPELLLGEIGRKENFPKRFCEELRSPKTFRNGLIFLI